MRKPLHLAEIKEMLNKMNDTISNMNLMPQRNEVVQSVLEFAILEEIVENTPNSHIDTETNEFNVDSKSDTSSIMKQKPQTPLRERLERMDREIDARMNRQDKSTEWCFWLVVCIFVVGIMFTVIFILKHSSVL